MHVEMLLFSSLSCAAPGINGFYIHEICLTRFMNSPSPEMATDPAANMCASDKKQ